MRETLLIQVISNKYFVASIFRLKRIAVGTEKTIAQQLRNCTCKVNYLINNDNLFVNGYFVPVPQIRCEMACTHYGHVQCASSLNAHTPENFDSS